MFSYFILGTWSVSTELSALMTGTLFIGMMVGSSMWGYVSDVHGRRKVVIFTGVGCVLFGVLSSLSGSFFELLVYRFCVGFLLSAGHSAQTYL